MGKRWSHHEDAMLLEYHSSVGADFVAEHDLGRPAGAGKRRLNSLTKSGARLAYAAMRIHQIEFDALAGRASQNTDRDVEFWEKEERAAFNEMNNDQ